MLSFTTSNYSYNKVIDTANIKLKFLSDIGYFVNGINLEQSKLVGESLVIDYINNNTGISIFVSFGEKFKNYAEHFSVIVSNKHGNKFLLSNYLNKHGIELYKNIFTKDDELISLNYFVEYFFDNLQILLKTELREIIEGKVWEDVRFDWYGYK